MRGYAIDHYGTLDDLRWREDLAEPPHGPRDLLVRVRASALNPSEWKILSGSMAGRFIHGGRFPLVLGFDFSGVIEAAGAEVADLAVGAEVFGFLPYGRSTTQGSFCERIAVAAYTVARKPATLTHAAAAASATTGVTALQALRNQARLVPGQRVLVNGASGGVGAYAVQIARALGAEVWGTCSAAKQSFVEGLGAARALDYRTTNLRDLGERFHVVLDAAATLSFGGCRRLLEPGGTFVTALPSPRFVLGLAASLFGSKRCRMVAVRPSREDLLQLAAWIADGQLVPPLDATLPLAELPEAMQRLKAGDVRGKIAFLHQE